MLQSALTAIGGEFAMIQACPACGTAIDTTDAEPLAQIACPNCGEKIRVERTFDHFVVVETVGVGGMGTVYKARDTHLDRFVALKLLRRDLSGKEDHNVRLQQEARIAASVNHPNVIQVFDSGTDHDQFYVVMELVDHGSLDDLIERRHQLPEMQVLEIGIQVAKGLRAAHQQGLIHRDVKPANILFVDEYAAKISDFGLAGVAGEESETAAEIWGTPYYVAPERLRKEPEDFRGDIYSLGATLFHAIAGKAPIGGETNAGPALLDLKKHPLDLHDFAPEASEATVSIFHRMIAPDSAQRFSSYDELLSNLEEAQRALIGMTHLPRDRRRRPRRWVPIGAALLIVLSAAVAMLFALRGRQGNAPARPAAPPVSSVEVKSPERAAVKRQGGDGAGRGDIENKIRNVENGPWNAALANYRAQVALYNFPQAAVVIKSAKPGDASFKQATEAAEKKAQLLIDWKNGLIKDLNRTHFSGALVDRRGAQYTGIASATHESLSLKLRYGIARVPWTELPPKALLKVSTSFIQPTAPDAADRQWRCAVFASETGQAEAARQLADAAAKTKPQYRDQISALFSDVSQPR
jgi:tRNA A-37 threonylcarbamoyl transferase component Bud32/DNA-directed RNA polymerase subunit RPC12/RpoP